MRQTDSSLLDEWEALTDPDPVARTSAADAPGPPPPRPLSRQERAFTRDDPQRDVPPGASWCARDDLDGLAALERAAADRTEPPRRW